MTCALADMHGELRAGGRCPECGVVRLGQRGPVPAKKSKYRRSRGGGMHLDRDTTATIDGLVLQARSQWHREPVDHREVTVRFHGAHEESDRDGNLATLLDVLQAAGVIRNDNVRHFNGWLHVASALPAEEPSVVVEITDGRSGTWRSVA